MIPLTGIDSVSLAERPPESQQRDERVQPTNRRQGNVRAIDRALQILLLMSRTQDRIEWTLEDVARGVGLPKSTTHRLLETLVGCGFAEMGKSRGTYHLGIQAAAVGHAALRNHRPAEDVHHVLETVVANLSESVGLSLLKDRAVVVIDRVTSPRSLRWNLAIGASLPADQCAAGKVLLSGLGVDRIRRLYGNHPFQPTTHRSVKSLDELLHQVGMVSAFGFALDDEEYEVGLRCVAVPVHDASGRLAHAITLAVPAARWEPDALRQCVPTLHRAAHLISSRVQLV